MWRVVCARFRISIHTWLITYTVRHAVYLFEWNCSAEWARVHLNEEERNVCDVNLYYLNSIYSMVYHSAV